MTWSGLVRNGTGWVEFHSSWAAIHLMNNIKFYIACGCPHPHLSTTWTNPTSSYSFNFKLSARLTHALLDHNPAIDGDHETPNDSPGAGENVPRGGQYLDIIYIYITKRAFIYDPIDRFCAIASEMDKARRRRRCLPRLQNDRGSCRPKPRDTECGEDLSQTR